MLKGCGRESTRSRGKNGCKTILITTPETATTNCPGKTRSSLRVWGQDAVDSGIICTPSSTLERPLCATVALQTWRWSILPRIVQFTGTWEQKLGLLTHQFGRRSSALPGVSTVQQVSSAKPKSKKKFLNLIMLRLYSENDTLDVRSHRTSDNTKIYISPNRAILRVSVVQRSKPFSLLWSFLFFTPFFSCAFILGSKFVVYLYW